MKKLLLLICLLVFIVFIIALLYQPIYIKIDPSRPTDLHVITMYQTNQFQYMGDSLKLGSHYLYWLEQNNTVIKRIDTNTGCSEIFFTTDQKIMDLEADTTHLYWITKQELQRKSHTQQMPQTIDDHIDRLGSLYLSNDSVYLTSFGEDTITGFAKDSIEQRAAKTIRSIQLPIDINQNGNDLYTLTTQGLGIINLTNNGYQLIYPTELFPKRRSLGSQLVTDNHNIYWIHLGPSGRSVWVTDRSTLVSQEIVRYSKDYWYLANMLEQDEHYIYGLSTDSDVLSVINKKTLETRLLRGYTGEAIFDMAVDDTWIYWITGDKISKMYKPDVIQSQLNTLSPICNK